MKKKKEKLFSKKEFVQLLFILPNMKQQNLKKFYELESKGILTKEKMHEIVPKQYYLPKNKSNYNNEGRHGVGT